MSKIFKPFLFLILLTTVYHLTSLNIDVLPKINLLPTVKVPLSGTGSMYPTIPKGQGSDQENANQTVAYMNMYRFTASPSAFSKLIYETKISRGDIVSFQNANTNQIEQEKYGKIGGFVKRIIGLPGETIELREGIVYIDNIGLREQYTALPHSTFGGNFLPDCQPLKIPPGKIFVMGDNRKQSNDSRHEVGLISLNDINFILPWDKQKNIWDKNFRDTSLDLDPSTKISTDKNQFLALLNQKRLEKNLPHLKYNTKLEKSATIRAETMLKTNDFSFSATRSGITQKVAMTKAGYWNPYYGETWLLGYYTADELIDNQLAFKQSADFVLDPKFHDFGIGIVQGNLNNCPTQLIVIHFAGYIPPNYPQDMVNSWVTTLDNLKDIASSWQNIKNYPAYYQKHQSDVDEINRIISLRLQRLPEIVEKLQKNQWLTDAENQYLKQDLELAKVQNSIADRLNSH